MSVSMSVRKLLTKINDAIRPPHVGPRESTSITALGGKMNAKDATELGAALAAQQDVQIGVPH
ncbi:MAG: hypothetical protein ACRDLK_08675 [Gaiellaceae bacterium]